MLNEGDFAPDFALAADNGQKVKLSKLKGRTVVLYFYPKDDTSGCTLEAQAFTALAPEFASAGAQVYGISPDTVESHCKFRNKYGLAVDLLADPERTVAEAYGVWVEKSMYGRRYMGVERTTFLIGPDGRVAAAWRKVKVPGHAEDVLAAVRALSTPGAVAESATAATRTPAKRTTSAATKSTSRRPTEPKSTSAGSARKKT